MQSVPWHLSMYLPSFIIRWLRSQAERRFPPLETIRRYSNWGEGDSMTMPSGEGDAKVGHVCIYIYIIYHIMYIYIEMLNKYEMTWTLDSDQSWRFSKNLDHVVTFSTAPGPGVRAKPDCQSSFRIGPVWVMSRWRGWEHIGHTSLSLHCGFMRFHEAMNLQWICNLILGCLGPLAVCTMAFDYLSFRDSRFSINLRLKHNMCFAPWLIWHQEEIQKWCLRAMLEAVSAWARIIVPSLHVKTEWCKSSFHFQAILIA